MADSIDFFPIQVEQVDWQTAHALLADIRTQVFIEEQNVPEEEEFDGDDQGAIHWIAWGESRSPMGAARLVGNKIGRMAVVKPYRQKGVGSALLRAIINYAVKNRLDNLVLDAQLHATGFYTDNGFAVTGDEFLDVGIPHVPMAMNLERFTHRKYEPALPDIDEEMRHRHQIDSAVDYRWSALQLVKHSDRTIRILSIELAPYIYDNEEFCHAIYQLVTEHPSSQVMILVRDTDAVSKQFHRLIETSQRLSSHIEIRRQNREIETPHEEFMTGDLNAVLYNQNPSRYTGYLCLYSPLEVKGLNEAFDGLWNHSLPDPQIRRLHL